jgi:hypothetical protein
MWLCVTAAAAVQHGQSWSVAQVPDYGVQVNNSSSSSSSRHSFSRFVRRGIEPFAFRATGGFSVKHSGDL